MANPSINNLAGYKELLDDITAEIIARLAAHNHTTADGTGPLTNDEHDGYIEMATSSAPTTPAAGKLRIYAEDVGGVARMRAKHSTGTDLAFFRDAVTRVRNTSGATIAKGSAVYITGSTGQVPTIAKAKANSLTTLPSFGLVTSDITNNAFGTVQFCGQLGGLDTSAFAEGDRVFLSSTTAGALTNVEPTHPSISQLVGVVITSNAGNGIVFVFPSLDTHGDETGSISNEFHIGDGSAGTKTIGFMAAFTGEIQWTPTADRVLTLPDSTGTIATQSYADGLVAGLLDDRGSYDASSNLFPSSGGSGAAGAIMKGDIWYISVAGSLGGSAVSIGDCVRALADSPGQTASNWSILETNIGYVPANVASTLAQFAATTSAQLAGVISDETGSGSLVFGTSPTITTPNIVGTATNNNATAGSVGEYAETIVSTTTVSTNGVWQDIGSLSLTAGDWEMTAQVNFQVSGGSVPTYALVTISSTAGNSSAGVVYGDNTMTAPPPTSGHDTSATVAGYRRSLSSTTTFYLKIIMGFSVASPVVQGRLSARRLR